MSRPRRRALTNVGGAIDTEGDRADAEKLAHALAVPPSTDAEGDPARTHVHGFHTYPARLHPLTAARLVAAFAPIPGKVLDPFCGSGTVLVEALVAGRAALGTDLNPLAVLLARCKTRPRSPAELDRLVSAAGECAAGADARRKAKAGASRRFPPEDVALFEPHVLLELDSLRAKIATLRDENARADLWLVLSALLVKLSRKRGDTSAAVGSRRTAAGFAARLLVRKTEELAERLRAFTGLIPRKGTASGIQEAAPPTRPPSAGDLPLKGGGVFRTSPLEGEVAAERSDVAGGGYPQVSAFVAQDDATRPEKLPPGMVDAIVTSPPYAATYDYLAHHNLRLRWLGLDASPLARGEIGSRSVYSRLKPKEARAAWAKELNNFLRAAAKVLPAGGPLVVVMADSAVGDVAIRADEVVAETARAGGFIPAARASQPRPHFHGPTAKAFRTRPRAEHALLLRKG